MRKPCFAVLGDVNPGKSAVVATLAQDSSTGISPVPGETSHAKRFSYRGLFEVWDTPGFQRPLKLLREVENARGHADPLSVFRDFVARNRENPQFATECELLKPVLEEGAALIYVVDPSRPFSKIHEAETEILKMTARPLLVVFNSTKPPDPENERRWSNHIKQHFGQAPMEFNAHRVTARERAALIREFANKCGSWGESYHEWVQPLRAAAESIERDFDEDLRNAAAIVVELLERAIGHKAEGFVGAGAAAKDKEAQRGKLVEAYKDAVGRLEARSHRQLIENFGHEAWIETDLGPQDFFAEGLFDAETAQVLGLSLGTLTITAAAAGAAAGGTLDVMVGGASFATGAVLGAAVAGGGAYFAGKSALEPATKEEGESFLGKSARVILGRRFGTGIRLVVGPVRNDNFAFILADRAIGLIAELLRRTHARRDRQRLASAELKAELDRAQASTEFWPADLRKLCLTFARSARDRVPDTAVQRALQDRLADHLRAIAEQSGAKIGSK
jgi:hypothetical protein